jgi:uncharacterized protein YcbX
MERIGRLATISRYPVKSMAGESVDAVFAGFSGVMGDRAYAFLSQHEARKGFPWYTARQQENLVRYRPRYRDDTASRLPGDVGISPAIRPGARTVFPGPDAFALDVRLPDGRTLPIDSRELRNDLQSHAGKPLMLRYSEHSLTDCRPLSLLGIPTVQALCEAIGRPIDPRRFRANLYADWDNEQPFREDGLIGRTLQLGDRLRIIILERDPRCKMITLDPDTGEMAASILRHVAQAHGGEIGVYAAVLVEGVVRSGDQIHLVQQ